MAAKSSNTVATLVAIFLIYLADPYFTWGGFLGTVYMRTVVAFIMGFCFLTYRKQMTVYEKFLFLFFLSTLVLFPVVGGYNFNYFVSVLPVITIPFSRFEFSKNVYQRFLFVFAILSGLGLISWILVQFGFISPFRIIPPLNPLKGEQYYVYPFLVSPVSNNFTRFRGVFDEPGVMGTFCGIMLCAEKMNFKNWKSWVLLLSGFASLSLFFFVIIAVYYLIHLLFEKKSYGMSLLLFFLITGVTIFSQNIPILREMIGDRLVWDSNKGKLSGDNRINYDISSYYLNRAIATDEIWFGIENKEEYMAEVEGSSSFLSVIILNGVVFSLLYILFFLLYASYYRESRISYLLFIIVFLGVLYQRPDIFRFVYVFLFSYLARINKRESSLYFRENN